jgi:hypothetical protein
MKLGRIIQAAVVVMAAFLLAASASASTITWNASSASTQFFVGSTAKGLTITSTDGLATLGFAPNTGETDGTPTNINYGTFTLTCATCSSTTQAAFAAFTIDLYITDTTDNVVGEFIGTSTGGNVSTASSTVDIGWTPADLGPGTIGKTSGTSFGTTVFSASSETLVPAPLDTTGKGVVTIQGTLNSTAVPEPATMAMVGGLFIGLGALARKRRKA